MNRRRNLVLLQNQLFHLEYDSLRNEPAELAAIFQLAPMSLGIRKNKEDILFEYYNWLNAYGRSTKDKTTTIYRLLGQARNLIGLITKEYPAG